MVVTAARGTSVGGREPSGLRLGVKSCNPEFARSDLLGCISPREPVEPSGFRLGVKSCNPDSRKAQTMDRVFTTSNEPARFGRIVIDCSGADSRQADS